MRVTIDEMAGKRVTASTGFLRVRSDVHSWTNLFLNEYLRHRVVCSRL